MITDTISKHADTRQFDRQLFASSAIAFALIVLAGFARTYYARALFASSPPLPSLLVHIHGVLMSTWVVLFITQVWFISSRRVRLHQRMGYAGVGLGALIIAVGIPTALRAGKYGSASFPAGVSSLSFLVVPMFDLLMFAVLFGAAIYYRRRPAAHKSLMLLTALNFLPPAIARIPVASLQAFGPLWFFGAPSVLALSCVGLDAWRRGRVNRIFLCGTLLLLSSYVVRLAIMNTTAWMHFAVWATRFV